MSHYRHAWIFLISLLFLGLDFPKFKTGEERALKNFQIGMQHYNSREYSLARENFLSVISEKRDFSLAKLYLSRSYYQSGDWLEALQTTEELAKKFTKESAIQNRLTFLRKEIANKIISTQETGFYKSIQGEKNRGFRFRNPVDIQVDENGNIYLLSFGTTNLISYSPNFEPKWVSYGGFAKKMKGPLSMDLGESDILVVDFPTDYLYRFNRSGDFLERLGGTGSELNQFRGPSGVTRDDKGNIYITDTGNHRILKWKKDFSPLFSFGSRGKGKLNSPTGIAWKNDRIYVLDKINPRIITYDDEGNFIQDFYSTLLKKPRSIRFHDTNLIVSDEETGLIILNVNENQWNKFPSFQDDRGITRNLDRPFSTFKDRYGYVYATDYNRNRVDIFAPTTYLLSNLNLEIEKIDTHDFPNIHIYFYLKNKKGQHIKNLNRRDFNLKENQNPKKYFDLTDMKKFNDRSTISLVYENSEPVVNQSKRFQAWLNPFFNQFTKNDRVELLRSGKTTTKILDYNVSGLKIFNSIRKSLPESNINSGKAIYQSLSNLSREIGSRSIIYLASGDYPVYSRQFSLQKITQFAKANGIQIYPVLLKPSQETDNTWKILAEETNGQLFSLMESNPNLYHDLQSHKDNRYVISYKTGVSTHLKGRWIPVSLDVNFRDFGGKTEGGYFVP